MSHRLKDAATGLKPWLEEAIKQKTLCLDFQWAAELLLEALAAEKPSDSERLDFLENNLHSLGSGRASCSVYMDGKGIRLSCANEARGAGAGPSTLRIRARSIREAVDEAINWKPE